MDKNVIGLLGGVSALALIGGSGAASAEATEAMRPARTYAELLDPIPNAAALLRADDQRAASASVQTAQYYYGSPYHHHHHHHHHHYRNYYGYAPYYYHPPPPPSPSPPSVGDPAAGLLTARLPKRTTSE